MSVDLVGSTAFKAKAGEETDQDGLYPKWLNRTKSFYRDFPRMLTGNCESQQHVVPKTKEFNPAIPQVWKTVGDEIIFCVRLTCMEHLALCYNAFVKSLSEYGEALRVVQPELDVKGCAWIAVFPAPNVTVSSASKMLRESLSTTVNSQNGEAQELQADEMPGDFDFLGKNIDTGFRISKFAQAHQMALSVELAWLLTAARHHQLISAEFVYHGREPLKGVINNQPYPVVTVETERDHVKRRLQELERAIGFGQVANHTALGDYLLEFMRSHAIDIPIVPLFGADIALERYPKCYHDFRVAWETRHTEDEKRDKSIEDSEAADDQFDEGTQVIKFDDDVTKFINDFIFNKLK